MNLYFKTRVISNIIISLITLKMSEFVNVDWTAQQDIRTPEFLK